MDFDLELACLTVDEILSDRYAPLPLGAAASDVAELRFQEWCRISADSNDGIFAKRLEREKHDADDVRRRFGGVVRVDNYAPPEWVEHTVQLIVQLKSGGPEFEAGTVAFGALLAPVVNAAASRLRRAVGPETFANVSSTAFDSIVDHLRQRLANLCELPFYESLLSWREPIVARAAAHDPDAIALLASDDFSPFLAHMRRSGFDTLVRRRPILFRLMETLISQWVEANSELLARLASDRGKLAALSPGLTEDCFLARVEWGASDPHNDGRSVMILVFEGDHRVVYKPKHLEPDLIVSCFLDQFSGSSGIDLVTPKVVAGNGYGWTEYIAGAPCSNVNNVDTYFRRTGAWLAIFHVLAASDMHMENFIARGDQPIPVDFETILQALRQKPKSTTPETEAHWLVERYLENSVQTVGMLPAYVRNAEDELVSTGALEASIYTVRRIDWHDPNTPRMRICEREETITISSNLPTLDGRPVSIGAHRDAFLDGVAVMLSELARNADEISNFLSKHARPGLTIRRVIRPTRFYYMLMKRLYDHHKMADSVLWSLESDFIARFFDWDEDLEQPWKLLASERRQCLALGIPYFTMDASTNIISDAGGPITRLHVDLGCDIAKKRIHSLSRLNQDAQLAIVRSSLQIPQTEDPDDLPQKHQPEETFALARSIRDYVSSRAFRAPQSMAWISLHQIDHEAAAQMSAMGHDSYYGSSGIALFFGAAAFAGLDGAATDARLATAATQKLLRSESKGRFARAIGLGGAVGLGSIIYAGAALYGMLADEEFGDMALAASDLVSDAMITADDKYDAVSGAAGTCLGLLALYRRLPRERILDRAIACAEHLLSRQESGLGGGQWKSATFRRTLTGMAHGSAGIALAFSRLYATTHDTRYRTAAQDSVAAENATFNADRCNWPDLREDAHPSRWPCQWCYGAAGIGQARLAMRGDQSVPKEVLDQDIERAIFCVRSAPPCSNDTLCCGTAGRIDFLLDAGRALQRPELLTEADGLIADISNRWAANRDARWVSGTRAFNVGLFQGAAGLGLIGVRSMEVRIPSFLVWD